MRIFPKNWGNLAFPAAIVIASSALLASGLHSYLLFHTFVELFTVVIAFGIFAIAWSSRRYIGNIFLLLIGISYFFVGSLDLIHALTYKGLNIIQYPDTNLPTQLWIAARYMEAFSFLLAFLFSKEENPKVFALARKKSHRIFFTYAAISAVIFSSIFLTDIFPDAYREGSGLTPFKIYSEYLISLLFVACIALLFKKREEFDRKMGNLLSLALIVKVLSEIAFTEYVGVYDFSNMLGHLLRFVSTILLYKAVLEGALMRPYQILFSDLQKSEERYRSLVELSPDAIVVHSGGKIIYANSSAQKIFGTGEKRKMIGEELAGFFDANYREMIKSRIKKVSSGELKRTPMTEMELVRPDGKKVPVEIKGKKIIFAGKPAVESIIRDVSERKAAEEKIRSLAMFPEENPNPVIRALASGEVQYANRPAREMLASLGWKEGDVLPRALLSDVKEVLERSIKHETEIACPSGEIYSIVFSPSSTEGWVNLYGRDITQRKRAEEELLKTQAQLRKRAEERLNESYEYLGLVNRKISLLLEMEEHSQDKGNKQEIMDHIVSSALGLARAKAALLYIAIGKNHFNLVSGTWSGKNRTDADLQVVSAESASFIKKLVEEKVRVNGPCELVDAGHFSGKFDFSYFVALPILSDDACKGFLFLGFSDLKSMDPQDLQFLDVFSRHVSTALQNAGILS